MMNDENVSARMSSAPASTQPSGRFAAGRKPATARSHPFGAHARTRRPSGPQSLNTTPTPARLPGSVGSLLAGVNGLSPKPTGARGVQVVWTGEWQRQSVSPQSERRHHGVYEYAPYTLIHNLQQATRPAGPTFAACYTYLTPTCLDCHSEHARSNTTDDHRTCVTAHGRRCGGHSTLAARTTRGTLPC